MKRILVPTDFSPTAERAFRLALDISKKTKGMIILYHAYKPEKNEAVSTAEKREMYNKQAEFALGKKLQRLKKKVTEGAGDIPISTVVGRTPTVDNILGFAEHNHMDLIVMGTQGAGGLRRTIVGSVASKVAELADIPVLLVPEKYELKDLAKIVYASDYAISEKPALSQVLAFARLLNAEVNVIHLISAYLTPDASQAEKDAFDMYAFSVQREFNDDQLKFKLLDTASFIDTMENLDNVIPYDLMIMMRRNKSFYEKFFVGSFTKNMAYFTKKLLLIIPEEKVPDVEKTGEYNGDRLSVPHDNLQIEKIIKRKRATN